MQIVRAGIKARDKKGQQNQVKYLCKLVDYDDLKTIKKEAVFTIEEMNAENLIFTIADAQMSKVQRAEDHNGSCRMRWYVIREAREGTYV